MRILVTTRMMLQSLHTSQVNDYNFSTGARVGAPSSAPASAPLPVLPPSRAAVYTDDTVSVARESEEGGTSTADAPLAAAEKLRNGFLDPSDAELITIQTVRICSIEIQARVCKTQLELAACSISTLNGCPTSISGHCKPHSALGSKVPS